MLFAQAHKEAKAGMKAHMANERKQHNAQLRKAAARKEMINARREVATTR
ncbi:hypothetical protein [Paenibacillus sp. PL2-23]